MLSERSAIYTKSSEFLMKCFYKCDADNYNSTTNKDGFVNCGTAVNSLCEDILSQRLNKGDLFHHKPAYQHYYGLNGTPDLLQATAKFLSDRFSENVVIDVGNIRAVNGVSCGLEAISWMLADPGQVILIPVPTYARFFADMEERTHSKVVGIQLSGESNPPFLLTAGVLEAAIIKQQNIGKVVKCFMFCNPSNPLGVVYGKKLILELLEVCKKYRIHFVSDEIYGLSIHSQGTKFTSVLSLDLNELPDPERTHWIWGLSKDFGMAGFRTGFVHSYNKDVIACLDGMALYTSLPAHIQQVSAGLLSDVAWLDNTYFPNNISRLRQAYDTVKDFFSDMDVKLLPAQAGLFCWADFSSYLVTKDTAGERKLFDRLFNEGKVYIVPGCEFSCKDPGWFRIIFAVRPENLKEALKRIKQVICTPASNGQTATRNEQFLEALRL